MIITSVAMVLPQLLPITADLIASTNRTHWGRGAMNRMMDMHTVQCRGAWLQVTLRFADYSGQRHRDVQPT